MNKGWKPRLDKIAPACGSCQNPGRIGEDSWELARTREGSSVGKDRWRALSGE